MYIPLVIIINPRRMREGYSCVSVSVTMLVATYLVYTLKEGAIRLFMAFSIVWLLLKTLCLKVLATFADHL